MPLVSRVFPFLFPVSSVFATYVNGGNLAAGEFFINDGTGQGVTEDITTADILALGAGIHEITYTETIVTDKIISSIISCFILLSMTQ